MNLYVCGSYDVWCEQRGFKWCERHKRPISTVYSCKEEFMQTKVKSPCTHTEDHPKSLYCDVMRYTPTYADYRKLFTFAPIK